MPQIIHRVEIDSFIEVFHKEHNGKEWTIGQFRKGLDNWLKTKPVKCRCGKTEWAESRHGNKEGYQLMFCRNCYESKYFPL